MECVFVSGIDVRFGSRHSNFDFIPVLSCLYDTKICADFVVTFGPPRNVVHVGKRVYVQDVDVSRCYKKVLDERSDHMPGFKEDQ